MSDVPPPPGANPPPPGGTPPPGGFGQQPSYGAPQPPPGQPAYGQPAYGAPGGAYQPTYGAGGGAPKTNVMAIVSLCLGLAGIVTCGTTCLAAVPLGFVGLSQIKASQGRETGRGLAIGGIAVSAVIIVAGIGAWVGLVLLADSADDIVDEICEDLDSDGDGINDCDDFDFDTTTIP
ncbi:hypothetical protein B7486_64060 [cyanobacterium TDX16]|nr:hypothetical protein B7486_64060 [cyanobacterium TDX16]